MLRVRTRDSLRVRARALLRVRARRLVYPRVDTRGGFGGFAETPHDVPRGGAHPSLESPAFELVHALPGDTLSPPRRRGVRGEVFEDDERFGRRAKRFCSRHPASGSIPVADDARRELEGVRGGGARRREEVASFGGGRRRRHRRERDAIPGGFRHPRGVERDAKAFVRRLSLVRAFRP